MSDIPEQARKCQEIGADASSKTKAAMVRPGKVIARKSLAHYQNAGIETSAYELVGIWFEIRPYSSVFNEVAMGINEPGPIASGSMSICHLGRYWATGRMSRTKQLRNV